MKNSIPVLYAHIGLPRSCVWSYHVLQIALRKKSLKHRLKVIRSVLKSIWSCWAPMGVTEGDSKKKQFGSSDSLGESWLRIDKTRFPAGRLEFKLRVRFWIGTTDEVWCEQNSILVILEWKVNRMTESVRGRSPYGNRSNAAQYILVTGNPIYLRLIHLFNGMALNV